LETQRPRRKLGENNHRTFTVMPLVVCKYGCSAGPIREARQVNKKQKTRNRKQARAERTSPIRDGKKLMAINENWAISPLKPDTRSLCMEKKEAW
jgi:iron only hydrogenase large subunit-like protein